MSKERKNIVTAIEEADMKLSNFLKARLSVEDYHEAVELSNIVTDLTVYAFDLAMVANKEKQGEAVDCEVIPVLGNNLDDGEEHD